MDRVIRKASIVFYCVTFVVTISFIAFAGNDEECFLRGNKLYESGNYDKALDAYQMIDSKGRAVLYNMGNCYYKKGDYSRALVFWSRAERRATAQEIAHIEQNKQHVFAKIGIHQADGWDDWLLSFFFSLIPYFSLLSLQLVFLMCWY